MNKKSLSSGVLRAAFFPLLILGLTTSPILAGTRNVTKYVVLKVTSHTGEIFHKAISEKEKDSFQKKALENYVKAKKLYLEEKKEFGKKNGGEKFSKKVPTKPIFRTAKRGLTDYRDAVKLAFELDKKLKEEKNGKNGKNGKESKEKNGKEKE